MNTHRRPLRCLATILSVCLFFALIPLSAAAAERWEYFIPGNDVQGVAFQENYVWCATNYSVVRWDRRDGTSMQIPTGGADFPGDIEADARGNVWIRYSGGNASRFDGVSWTGYGNSNIPIAQGGYDETMDGMLADRSGNMWFSVPGLGAARFDGSSWMQYKSDLIYDMAEAPDGAIWFATANGLSRFDGSSWKTWTTADGLTKNVIDAVTIAPDGGVWCAAAGMLCHFNGAVFTVYPGPTAGNANRRLEIGGPLAVDAKGLVWACAGGRHSTGYNTYRDGGLWRFRDGAWETFPLGFGEGDLVGGVHADDRGTIWYVTSLGLVHWDGSERRLFRVNAPDHILAAEIVADLDGTVWLTSSDTAAVTYVSSFSGDRWKVYARGFDPVISAVHVQVDERNRKWFTMFNYLQYLDEDSLKAVFSDVKTPDFGGVTGIVVEKNGAAVWFGSGQKGLFRWDGANWTNFTTADGLTSNNATPLGFGPDGTLWCATGLYPDSPTGIAWFDGRFWENHALSGPVNAVAFGKDGMVWFGAWKSIIRFDGVSWTEFTDPGTLGRIGNIISLAVDDNGVLWACTFMEGVIRYDGREWKRYTTANGLLSGRMSAVGVDRLNRKWFATGAGYCVLDDTEPSKASETAPAPLALLGNRPNPFNGTTVVEFFSSTGGTAALDIHDILGRRVRRIETGILPAGRNTVAWDGADDRGARVSSGVYLYRMETGGHVAVGKMLMIR